MPGNGMSPRRRRAVETLGALAELFPNCFVREAWRPHRPLKVGIHQDLIAAGILTAKDGDALRVYVRRLAYQRALAAGGARYDLAGLPCGEVSADERAAASASVAATEASRAAAFASAIAAYHAQAPRHRVPDEVAPKTTATFSNPNAAKPRLTLGFKKAVAS